MEYFVGHEIPQLKLDRIIGSPIKKGIRGTTSYFIKEISSKSISEISTLVDGKGLFQLFEKGLLLRIFKSAKTYSIALPFSEIEQISLIEGKHIINPVYLSPFWIALNLGMNINTARYFARYAKEYKKEDTVLSIITADFTCRLISNGYSFNSEARFFGGLSMDKKEIRKTVANNAYKAAMRHVNLIPYVIKQQPRFRRQGTSSCLSPAS